MIFLHALRHLRLPLLDVRNLLQILLHPLMHRDRHPLWRIEIGKTKPSCSLSSSVASLTSIDLVASAQAHERTTESNNTMKKSLEPVIIVLLNMKQSLRVGLSSVELWRGVIVVPNSCAATRPAFITNEELRLGVWVAVDFGCCNAVHLQTNVFWLFLLTMFATCYPQIMLKQQLWKNTTSQMRDMM